MTIKPKQYTVAPGRAFDGWDVLETTEYSFSPEPICRAVNRLRADQIAQAMREYEEKQIAIVRERVHVAA